MRLGRTDVGPACCQALQRSRGRALLQPNHIESPAAHLCHNALQVLLRGPGLRRLRRLPWSPWQLRHVPRGNAQELFARLPAGPGRWGTARGLALPRGLLHGRGLGHQLLQNLAAHAARTHVRVHVPISPGVRLLPQAPKTLAQSAPRVAEEAGRSGIHRGLFCVQRDTPKRRSQDQQHCLL